MKIFFTASLRGKEFYGKQYKEIFDIINTSGYENLDDEIFNLNSEDYYKKIKTEGRNAFVDLYKRKIKRIQDADICIFEGSFHSLSIGYLIQKAIEFNKPTIVLYFEDNIPHFLAGVEDEKLIVKNYNEKNLKEIFKACIDEATELRDKRFNFFISPELLSYLEGTSKKLNITKSTFIRNLIQEHRRKYKDRD